MTAQDQELLQELITRINGLSKLDPIPFVHISTNVDSKTLLQADIDAIVAPEFPNYDLFLSPGDPYYRLDVVLKSGG